MAHGWLVSDILGRLQNCKLSFLRFLGGWRLLGVMESVSLFVALIPPDLIPLRPTGAPGFYCHQQSCNPIFFTNRTQSYISKHPVLFFGTLAAIRFEFRTSCTLAKPLITSPPQVAWQPSSFKVQKSLRLFFSLLRFKSSLQPNLSSHI